MGLSEGCLLSTLNEDYEGTLNAHSHYQFDPE